jgi:uncharacterized membrane protein YfcA
MNFILALFTGLGVGSGGLYIFYLTLLKDLPQADAQGLNLIFFITASLAAATVNLIKKRIPLFPIALLTASGTFGAVLGSFAAGKVNGRILSVLFGILLAVLGIISFFSLLNKSK